MKTKMKRKIKLTFLLILVNIILKTNSQTTIDPEIDRVINQLFNTSQNTGDYDTSPTYTSGPPNNNGVTQDDCQICVPYYLCDPATNLVVKDGVIDGAGIINIRISSTRCKHYLDVCCNQDPNDKFSNNVPNESSQNPYDYSTIPTTSTTQYIPPAQAPKCGQRNTQGIGFKISDGMDGEAQFGEFPWMIEILNKNTDSRVEAICGGSLIHPQAVLTGAHCIRFTDNSEKRPRDLIVRAGEWDTQTEKEALPYQERNVNKIYIHEQFNSKTLYHDIAILILESPFNYADNVGTICLPEQSQEFSQKNCVASGWGKDVFGQEGRVQTILKKIELPIVPYGFCQQQLKKTKLTNKFNLHTSFICAGGERGKDTCKGDGGSPLACPVQNNQYIQAGIVSWGIGCGEQNIPGVYTNVALYRDWIDLRLRQSNIIFA